MSEEEKTIEELLKEYYNRPLELIEENKKLKKKIDKLQEENEELKKVHNEFLELHQKLKARDTLLCKENILNTIKENYISKDIIRTKIKELEEEQKRKKHISNSIGCANTTNYVNINNEREIKILKELLGEKTNE